MASTPDNGFDPGAFSAPTEGFAGDPADDFPAAAAAAAEVEAPDAEVQAIEAEVGDDLVALKRSIEDRLLGVSDMLTAASAAQTAGPDSNIVGVGYGSMDGSDLGGFSANVVPGEQALVVFTVEPMANEAVIREFSSAAGTRALSTVPVIQVPVGVVDAYSHRMRMRPSPNGISCGSFRITAGTQGALVVGRSAPRSNRLMILSNNHVLAASNGGSLGDAILQPGVADGGLNPADRVAILERFVPINFAAGAINFVDCATGWAWPNLVRREMFYLSGGAPVFFACGNTPVPAAPGMIVGKTGRTTQLKQGRVTAVGVTVNVNFGAAGVAHFRDQISITGTGPQFSAGGDSGSLIWRWDATRAPVALLFAGGGATTFGNRIDRVLTALDVRKV